MKCFDVNQSSRWGSKVNYVDSNNRVLGFDMSQDCCERFGHGVFDHVPSDERKTITADIEAYSFVDELPTECLPDSDSGGGLAFRITADGKPDLYVCIWNHHNGYYSHGWTAWNGKGSL